MSSELEAAGDAITGALVGRAVEGKQGESAAHGTGACLNCGVALTGPYCHACGQQAHVHRTLTAIWHDIAHGVFHFEGKIWRTLPLLMFKPGALTRRYVAGERARFVSPMALFLFSVFLMFAVISAVGGALEVSGDVKLDAATNTELGVRQSREKMAAELARIDKKIAEAEAAGKDTRELKKERVTVSGIKRIMEDGPTVLADAGNRGQFAVVSTGWPRLDKGIAKANENPGLLLYKLQTNAYKFSWALIPISVPFVWLMFAWRRRFHVYDHAVFVTYSLSFMMLLAIVLIVGGAVGLTAAVIAISAIFIPPIHMYKQLRYAYGLTHFSAIWRTVALLLFASIASTAFILLLIALGLVG